MTLAELRAFALAEGFSDPNLAAAVAMAESGGNPCALGDPQEPANCSTPPVGPSTSFGLWQIHVPAHPEYDPGLLLDPHYNAAAALRISRGGRDWSAWSTFTSRRYAQYLPGSSVASSPAALGLFALLLGAVVARRARVVVF